MTKIRIRAGNSVTITGPAVIHVDQVRPVPAPEASGATSATMAGLAEAIALMTARRNGIPLTLSGDVPPGSVTAALAIIAVGFLSCLLSDGQATALLTDIALAAAREGGTPPNKETR